MVKSIRIVHQSPRILAATFSQMGIRFNVLVAHAHHSGRPASEQLEWWHLLRHVHDHVLPQPVRTLVLIDANAALGEQRSEAVGSMHAEPSNAAGKFFHRFLLAAKLWLPATYLQIRKVIIVPIKILTLSI